MSAIVNLSDPVDANESADLDVTMYDLSDPEAALDEASIVTLTLTLYQENTKRIINSRNNQSVKDVNGGDLAVTGVLTMKLQPADNAMIDSRADSEWHIALFRWTWVDSDALTREGHQKIRFEVTRSNA